MYSDGVCTLVVFIIHCGIVFSVKCGVHSDLVYFLGWCLQKCMYTVGLNVLRGCIVMGNSVKGGAECNGLLVGWCFLQWWSLL